MMTDRCSRLADLTSALSGLTVESLVRLSGSVTAVAEDQVTIAGLSHTARLGDLVSVGSRTSRSTAIVARLTDSHTIAVPVLAHARFGIGEPAIVLGRAAVAPDVSWNGRTVDAFGIASDGGPPLRDGPRRLALEQAPPPALLRRRTGAGIRTGVTAIDVFTPICEGQRIGVFAGSGVGKSTLLAMLARLKADVVVICLVGERGREVRAFLEEALGPAREKAICVVATGDDSAVMRRLAPRTAMTIAEAFRDQGASVALLVDSLTRAAHAQREFAMAAGEVPVARGFPPSVFRDLAALLERAGPGEKGRGRITLIATVLVDGDDHNEPISDAVRGILDGHIVLDRSIATGGRWPAIDVMRSLSRLADSVWSPDQAQLVRRALSLISRFEETRDLRALGEYRPGGDPQLDQAVRLVPLIYRALSQSKTDPPPADPFRLIASLLDGR